VENQKQIPRDGDAIANALNPENALSDFVKIAQPWPLIGLLVVENGCMRKTESSSFSP